jgi:AICAR transformylase/IMP cyclohydrolase PurH
MEAAQQTAIAVAHLFYGVPLDVEFVATDCSAKFLSVANIDEPLIADQTVSAHVYRRGRLVRMHTTLVIHQAGLERVRLAGTMVLLKREQLRHLEERASTTYPFNAVTIGPSGSRS